MAGLQRSGRHGSAKHTDLNAVLDAIFSWGSCLLDANSKLVFTFFDSCEVLGFPLKQEEDDEKNIL